VKSVKSNHFSNGFAGGQPAVVSAQSVGQFVGSTADGYVLTFTSTRGIAENADDAFVNAQSSPDRHVDGAILFSDPTTTSLLSLPEPAVETSGVTWGAWDNPVEDNWVVVNQLNEDLATIATDDYQAELNPTPVANLQGSATYGTSAASSFIGSGSAGDVTQVVAGMDVDFNSGAISAGQLAVEVAGSQVWNVDFNGSVTNGLVDLNMTSGQLSNFGNVLSNSIEADLGGVFTGNGAEAFVGGFDLVDQINAINDVNGLYTIER
jgi:hypothetical protein